MKSLPDEFPLEERTMGILLARVARVFPEKAFIIDVAGESITYEETDRRTNRIARALADLGIEPRDPLLFMLPDGIDLVTLVCGIARRGAFQVPINLAYRGSYLSQPINNSGSRSIVIDAAYLDRLAAVADELPTLQRCIVFPQKPSQIPAAIDRRFEILDFAALLAGNDAPVENTPAYHDLIGIMYTSGTTGPSKGVMVSHAHAYRYANNLDIELTAKDRYYTAGLPLFHIAGQWAVVYRALIRGATVILRRGYRNGHFWPDIREYGATFTTFLGAIANFVWQQPVHPDDADNPLEVAGMFPVMPEWRAFSERFGVALWTTYACTECPPVVTCPPGESFASSRHVGQLKDNVDVRILDGQDRECPPGTVGEICVRPHNPWEINLGYWRRPDATVQAFRNLWFHTGDAGFVDDGNRLYFVDRTSDSMRRRGENISSMEVEGTINEYPDVLECAVFGISADESEQEVMATIIPQPGIRIDLTALVRFLNARMPYFMVPRYIDVVAKIPKTPTGKMQKHELRQRGVTDVTWDRVAAGVKLER